MDGVGVEVLGPESAGTFEAQCVVRDNGVNRLGRVDLDSGDTIDECKISIVERLLNAQLPQDVIDDKVVYLVKNGVPENLSGNPNVERLHQARHYSDLIDTAYLLVTREGDLPMPLPIFSPPPPTPSDLKVTLTDSR